MNRRQSLRALALGSVGAVSPLSSWESPVSLKTNDGLPNEDLKNNDTTGVVYAENIQYNTVTLVAGQQFLQQIGGSLPAHIVKVEKEKPDQQGLLNIAAAGGAIVWIGSPENLPKELSVGAFRPSVVATDIGPAQCSPLKAENFKWGKSVAFSAYIAPPKEMPNHNIDEEVRADFLPVLEAYDRFGNLTGYPAVVMSYYAPSLAESRFKGSECFFFFTEEPQQLLNTQQWQKLLEEICIRRESGLQVFSFDTQYALYRPGERVQVRTRICNRRKRAVQAYIKLFIQHPGAKDFVPLAEMRRVAQGESSTEALCDFPVRMEEGMYTLRMEIWQDPAVAEKLAQTGDPVMIDRRDIGFMVAEKIGSKEIMTFNGPSIVLEGKEGFWSGTHYYPSTSWWEWVWRDFRPLKAAEDLAAIRRAGYRIVRVWVDPVIDEPVLRAIDATILLAAQQGLVLDICVFTQWVRQMGFERKNGEHILFEFRNPKDFNIVSFSLRNLDLQREYLSILAARWKDAGNIFYNIANESYVKDPDASQMDKEVQEWKDIPKEKGQKRDSLLFRGWAREMKNTIRKAGGNQVVMPGYVFSTMDGGDLSLCNADSPIIPWHSYLPTERTGGTLQYFDPLSSGKPILLEEFGILGWNNEKNYDGHTHYALAAGAAGAMSYEWGLSWLSRESCYWPIPLREAGIGEPDPRWFPPYLELHKIWSENGVGLAPTPSGAGYGSIYHCTPFPAPAAVALSRLGLMGQGLQRKLHPEQVYVIIPETHTASLEAVEKTLKELWQQHVLFGIWQEAQLDTLPSSVKKIIIPASLTSSSSKGILDSFKSRGVTVYQSTDVWKKDPAVPVVKLSNAEGADMLVRRTASGTLLTLVTQKELNKAGVLFEGQHVVMNIGDFGLVHITSQGAVTLMEGKGAMGINGKSFCTTEAGRLIVASEDGKSLEGASQLRLMTTGTGTITFRRNIASVSISDGTGRKTPVTTGDVSKGGVLRVDDQLQKYVIHVTFR